MGHMEPVYESGEWLVLDGKMGVEVTPLDIMSKEAVAQARAAAAAYKGAEPTVNKVDGGVSVDYPQPDPLPDLDLLLRYIEGKAADVWHVAIKKGYGVRLTAPGYLDATPWEFYSSKRAAEERFKELEEELSDDEDEDD